MVPSGLSRRTRSVLVALALGAGSVVATEPASSWPEPWVRLEALLVRAPDQDAAFTRLAAQVAESGREADWAARLDAASSREGAPSGVAVLRARLAELRGEADAGDRWEALAGGSVGMNLAARRAVAAGLERTGRWAAAHLAWARVADAEAESQRAVVARLASARAASRAGLASEAATAFTGVAGVTRPGEETWPEVVQGVASWSGADAVERLLDGARPAPGDEPRAWLAWAEAAWLHAPSLRDEAALDALSRVAADAPAFAAWSSRGLQEYARQGRAEQWLDQLEGEARRRPAAERPFVLAEFVDLALGESPRRTGLAEAIASLRAAGGGWSERADAAARRYARFAGDGAAWWALCSVALRASPSDVSLLTEGLEAARASGDPKASDSIRVFWRAWLASASAQQVAQALERLAGSGETGLQVEAAQRLASGTEVEVRTMTRVVELLVAAGERDEAIRLAGTNGGGEVRSPADGLSLVRRWELLGETERAREVLEFQRQRWPEDFGLLEAAWRDRLARGDREGAMALFDALVSLAPNAGLRDEIESRHVRMLAESGAIRAWLDEGAALLASDGGVSQLSPDRLRQLWRAAQEAGDRALGRALAAVASARFGSRLDLARLAAEQARIEGDVPGRIAAWRRLAEAAPDLAGAAWLEVARLALAERQGQALQEALTALARLRPGDPEVDLIAAQDFMARGDRESAAGRLRLGLARGGLDPEMRGRLLEALMTTGTAEDIWPSLVESWRLAPSESLLVPLVDAARRLGRVGAVVGLVEAVPLDPGRRQRLLALLAEQVGDPGAALAAWAELLRRNPGEQEVRDRLLEAARRRAIEGGGVPEAVLAVLDRPGLPAAEAWLLAVIRARQESGRISPGLRGLATIDLRPSDWRLLERSLDGSRRGDWLALLGQAASRPDGGWAARWVLAEERIGSGDLDGAERLLLDLVAESRPSERRGAGPSPGPDSGQAAAIRARQRYLELRGLAGVTVQAQGVPASGPPEDTAEAAVFAAVALAGISAEQGREVEFFAAMREVFGRLQTPVPARALLWLNVQARGPLLEEIRGMVQAGIYDGPTYRYLHEVMVNTRLFNRAGTDLAAIEQAERLLASEVRRREPSERAAFALAEARRLRDFGRRPESVAVLRDEAVPLAEASTSQRAEAVGLALELGVPELALGWVARWTPEEVSRSPEVLAPWFAGLQRFDPAVGGVEAGTLTRAYANLAAAWALDLAGRGAVDPGFVSTTDLFRDPPIHPRIPTSERPMVAVLHARLQAATGEEAWVKGIVEARMQPAWARAAWWLDYVLSARLSSDERSRWWLGRWESDPQDPWSFWAAVRLAGDPSSIVARGKGLVLPAPLGDVFASFLADRGLPAMVQARQATRVEEAAIPAPMPSAATVPVRPLVPPAAIMAPASVVPQPPVATPAPGRSAGWLARQEVPQAALVPASALIEQASRFPGSLRLRLDAAEALELEAGREGDRGRALEQWRLAAALDPEDPATRARIEERLMVAGEWWPVAAMRHRLASRGMGAANASPWADVAFGSEGVSATLARLAELTLQPRRAELSAFWLEVGLAADRSAGETAAEVWRFLRDRHQVEIPAHARTRLAMEALSSGKADEAAAEIIRALGGSPLPSSRAVWLGRLAEERPPAWADLQPGMTGQPIWLAAELFLSAPRDLHGPLARGIAASLEGRRREAAESLLALARGDAEGFAAAQASWPGVLAQDAAPQGWAEVWWRDVARLLAGHLPLGRATGVDPLDGWFDRVESLGPLPPRTAAELLAARIDRAPTSSLALEQAPRLARLAENWMESDPVLLLEAARALAEAGVGEGAGAAFAAVASRPGVAANPALRRLVESWRQAPDSTGPSAIVSSDARLRSAWTPRSGAIRGASLSVAGVGDNSPETSVWVVRRRTGVVAAGGEAWRVTALPGRTVVIAGEPFAWSAEGTPIDWTLRMRAWPGSTVRAGLRFLAADGSLLGDSLEGSRPGEGDWRTLSGRIALVRPIPATVPVATPPAGTATILPLLVVTGEAEVGAWLGR